MSTATVTAKPASNRRGGVSIYLQQEKKGRPGRQGPRRNRRGRRSNSRGSRNSSKSSRKSRNSSNPSRSQRRRAPLPGHRPIAEQNNGWDTAKNQLLIKSGAKRSQANPVVASAAVKILLAGWHSTAKNALSPTSRIPHLPTIPRMSDTGSQYMFESVQSDSHTVDIMDVIKRLDDDTVPQLFNNLLVTKVWPSKKFTLVQNHDALCPAIYPRPAAPNRQSTAHGDFIRGTLPLSTFGAPNATFDLCFQGPLTSATGVVRPVVKMLGGGEQYFWVDAAPTAVATLSVGADLMFSVSAATLCRFGAYFHMQKFIGPDDPGVDISAAAGIQVVDPNVGVMNHIAASWPITHSGYYRVTLRLIEHTNAAPYPRAVEDSIALIQLVENTTVESYHVYNSSHANSLSATSDSYWLAGSGVLCSCRAPALVTGGTIYAASTDGVTGLWFNATSSFDALHSQLAVDRTFNSRNGGKLIEGVWAYGRPTNFPTSLRTIGADADQPGAIFGAPNRTSAVAYLLPSDTQKCGQNVMQFSPSTATFNEATPVVEFRFTTSVCVDYDVISQLVAGERPAYLSADDWGALMDVLVDVPRFTSNDWHDNLAKVAVIAARIAKGAVAAGQFIGIGAKFLAYLAML